MKKFALAFLLLFSALSFQTDRADANGATVVFLQVRYADYMITSAVRDKGFNTSKLYNVLESSSDNLYVARIDPFIHNWATYYTAAGDDVVIPFQGYEKVVFRYYPSVRAIIGVASNQDVLVLLPSTNQFTFSPSSMDRDALGEGENTN